MASNTTLNPGASGDVIATKERTHDGDATKVQVVTLAGVSGTEGSYTFGDIGGDATNGLDVDVTRTNIQGNVDTAAGATQIGVAALSVRDDALATLTEADGDLTLVRTNARGAVWVALDSTAAQNVTLAASTNTNEVVGDAAHDAAAAGNPLLVGGYASAAAPTDVSADGDAVRAWMLRNGAQATVVTAAGALIGGDATNGLDVDVTRIVPGTGATNLGKAEDAAHASGDTGVMALAVRRDADTTLAATDGDYVPLQCNAAGSLKVAITAGAGSGGTSIADGATFTRDTTSITPVGAVVESSAPTLTNGDAAGLSMTTGGALRVAVASGGVAGQIDDAAFTAGTTEGVPIMGYYSSTRDLIDSGDGGAVAMNARRAVYMIPDGLVSTANSTTSNLAGAAVFTGTSEETTDYAQIHVSVYSSHASATDGLSLQQSSDATNWDITDTYTIAATTAKVISMQPAARYFRLVYTNGGTLTTSLRIQTIYKATAGKPSSQRPADATSNENDFEMQQCFLMGYNGTTWDRLRTTGTGVLNVVLTASTATQEIVGDAATDAAVSGNPVYIAGRGNSGTPTAMSANNDVTPLWLTLNGAAVVAGDIVDDAAFTPGTSRVAAVGFTADETATDSIDEGDLGAARMTLNRKLIAQPYESEANTWSYAAAAGGLVNTTGVTAKAAAGAGLRNYITAIQVINSHQTTGTEVVVRDGAAGTVIHRGWAAPNAGYAATFPTALRGTANTLVEIAEVTTTATAGVLVNLQGYVGA